MLVYTHLLVNFILTYVAALILIYGGFLDFCYDRYEAYKMGQRAKKPCSQPGCTGLTVERYCERHKTDNRAAAYKKDFDKARQHDTQRKMYATDLWKRTRIHVLTRDPICRIAKLCDGKGASVIVDHVTPARIYSGSFYDTDNLQGCCKRCHDYKTATEDSTFTGAHK